MAKDVNIHVKTPGAKQAADDLNKTGKAAKGVGDKTAEGQRRGADATDKTTQKLSGMGGALGRIKGVIVGFIGAWAGLQGIQKALSAIIEKLERIAQLQKEFYESSLSYAEIGQALELQTGTIGEQADWAKKAIAMQKAGALPSVGTAGQMMIAADIAFAAQGGIKDQAVMQLLTDISPMFGAAGLGAGEVGKFFEFAGIAGTAPTADAYKGFYSKLYAGYTASKATDLGQYLTALQKGGTAYMAEGGTLEGAISGFVGARAVTPNEMLAATALEQVSRIASGVYAKPVKAMERAIGVRWQDLSMDEKTQAVLDYITSLPESQRVQVLTAKGFPGELTTTLGKIVSPEALASRQAAAEKVGAAGPEQVAPITEAYMQYDLAKQRQLEAAKAQIELETGPRFGGAQRRIAIMRKQHEALISRGADRWVRDRLEPYVMALEEIRSELQQIPPDGLTESERERQSRVLSAIDTHIAGMTTWPVEEVYRGGLPTMHVQAAEQALSDLKQARAAAPPPPEAEPEFLPANLEGAGGVTVNHNYHNEIIYNPVVGESDIGPRVANDDVY